MDFLTPQSDSLITGGYALSQTLNQGDASLVDNFSYHNYLQGLSLDDNNEVVIANRLNPAKFQFNR